MSRIIFYVPRMYTEIEFKRLTGILPDDFKEKTAEFWNYIEEKLLVVNEKIRRIYRDGICKSGKEALNQLSSIDRENYLVVKRLVEKGARFEATEDPMLVAESESWIDMLETQQSNSVILELYNETMEERDEYIANRIDETLKDDEIGVLFIESGRNIKLSGDVKIVRMYRFDPLDYLRSWQVQLKLESAKASR